MTLAEIAAYMPGIGLRLLGHHRPFQSLLPGQRTRTRTASVNKSRKSPRLNRQFAAEGRDFRFLTGVEVDILTDGRLDFDDDLLAELDVVVASIHQGFTQSEAETTRRLIRAAENPFVHMLGHLTGRLLLEREPYKVNQTAVIDACAATGTWIELNASPLRCDMDWRLWHYAKDKGVKCAINCDAHRYEARRPSPFRRGVCPQRLARKKGRHQHPPPARPPQGPPTKEEAMITLAG